MARLRLTAALALLVSSALGVPPVVTLFNDTGNGTALVNWSPTAGANDYLVSAESFSFQETFPDGAMTPGAWRCASPSCANGAITFDATTYPGNVTMNMVGGNLNYCRSWLADCNYADLRYVSTTEFSVKTSFSISAFVDIGTPNGGVFQSNTHSGIAIFDATRNFLIISCGMVTWSGNTYRECKTYNDTNLFGAPTGFVYGPKGTGAFRLDFNPSTRSITVVSGSVAGGPWFPTTQTVSLDALPLPPFLISSLRVGLWARQWSNINTFSLFSSISITGPSTPTVTARALTTTATLRLPPFVPFRVRVIARNADLSWLDTSSYTTGLSLAPAQRVRFPLNASFSAYLGLSYRHDFTVEGSAPGLAQSNDLSGNGFWLQQKTAALRPAVQPFAQGEHSALRMQGTSENPLGYMQIPYMNMPPASASRQRDLLNHGTGHSVTVVVFTPGRQTPSIGSGTGNVINKGLTSDATGGFQIAQTGFNPGTVFHKFRGAGNTYPDSVTVASVQRTSVPTTAGPTVYVFGNSWFAVPRGATPNGCHMRYLFEWETGRPYITPTIFAGTAGNTPPPPGPARLPNPWSFGGPGSDADASYRSGLEVAPCNYTGACQGAPCVYDFSRQGKNEDLFTVGADSDGANQFIGDIYESFRFQLFSNLQAYPLFAATTTLIMPYLQAKYYSNCPSAINPTANSTTPAGYAPCLGPAAEGEVCTTSCLSAFGVLAFGAQSLTCSAGRWMGGTGGFAGPLVCATSCPALPAPPNAASCTLVQTYDSFTALSGPSAGTELHGYVQSPAAPDAYVRGGSLWLLVDDGSGLGNNTVLSADSGDRANLPAAISTVLLFQSSPAWTSSQTSASVSASGITVTCLIRIQSAGTGAGLVWAASPTTGGALQYYQLLFTPTSDGLGSGATFRLAYVVNNTVTQMAAGSVPGLALFSWASVSVVWYGSLTLVSLNGVLIASASQSAGSVLPIGGVGVVLSGGAAAQWDDLTVTASCSSSGGNAISSARSPMVVSWTCPAGYSPVGSSTRVCSSSGTWSGSAFSCALVAPTFMGANFTIPEKTVAGAVVGTVNASTAASMLVTYAIASSVPGVAFALDACSGALTVSAPNLLVYATNPVFTLVINALTNNDASALTQGIVRVSLTKVAKPPVLVTTSVSILVNSTVGTAASPALIAYDDTGAQTNFAVSSSSGSTFSVVPTGNSTATLVLATPGALNFWTSPSLVVSLVLTSASNASLTTVATVNVDVLYAPTTPTMSPGQILSMQETLAAVASTTNPAWTSPISVTSINAEPVYFSYALVAVYGGALTDGTAPALFGSANPLVVNATTGAVGLTVPLVVTDASKQLPVDVYMTRAAYTVTVRVTDNSGLSTTSNASVLILVSNSVTNVALLSQVSPRVGYSTVGGSTITLAGSAFDGLVNLTARVVYGPYTATDCVVNPTVGDPLFPGYTPACVTCLNVPGSGAGWPVALYVGSVKIQASAVLTLSYAAPEVSDVSPTQPGLATPPPTSVLTGALSTQGGERFYLSGQHLGQSFELANISVTYGPPSNPRAYTATVLDAGDTWLLVSSSPGFGNTLVISVTVSGQTAVSTSTGLAYGTPLITSISGLMSADDPTAMPTDGGTRLVFRGINFGPATLLGVDATQDVSIAYGYSLADPTSLIFVASGCAKNAAAPHTTITCTSVGGVGAGLVASIVVSGVVGTVASSNLVLSYASPVVTRISGAGVINANTAGGGLITVEGSGFGPASLNGATSLAPGTPGWQRGPGGLAYGRYFASGCAVLSSTLLTCSSAQGTGSGYSWILTIAGQTANYNDTLMSYGAPVLYTLSGPGADSGTPGGAAVLITGQNLGANASVVSAFYTSAFVSTTSALGIRSVTFNATGCSITTPHTQLTCYTAPGAGSSLSWGLVVDGLASVTPETAYLPPSVASITNATGGPAVGVHAGETCVILGSNFAPSPATGSADVGPRGYVDWLTFGPTGTEYVVSDWIVLSHSSISFVVPEGFGSGHLLRLSVGGQLAGPAAGATLSYALPSIRSVTPRAWTTLGGVTTTLTGVSFALTDPAAAFGVLLGNPSDGTTTSLLPLRSALQDPVTGACTVTFTLPAGVGPNRAVRFAVYRASLGSSPPLASLVLSDPLADTPAYPRGGPDLPFSASLSSAGSFFSYAAPNLTFVSLGVAATPAQIGFLSTTLSCPPTSASSCGPYYLLELTGSEFGPDPTTHVDAVSRTVEFADFYSGAVLPPPALPSIFSWGPTSILVFTTLPQARVRVRLGSDSWTRSVQNVSSQWLQFESFAPAVSALVSGQLTNIPTLGTPAVATVQVQYMLSASAIRVTVGRVDAVLYDPQTGNSLTQFSAVPVVLATRTADGIVSISFRMPPGQGSSNALQILRFEGGSWHESSGSAGWFVSYAPPTLTQAGVQAVDASGNPIPGSFAMQPITAGLNVFAPSDGSLFMRITGSNLGVCPTVTLGYAYILLCDDRARNLTATTGATFDAPSGTITFPVPVGEGMGFTVIVDAADQNTAGLAWSLSYAPATIAYVAAETSTAGIPTTGGTRVIVTGRGFGTHIQGSPTAWGWSATTISASSKQGWVRSSTDPFPPITELNFGSGASNSSSSDGWVQCVDVIRLNDTALSCVVPEGDGTDLAVRVTVANSPPVVSLTGVFSYDPPTIASIECFGTGCGPSTNTSSVLPSSALWTPSSNASLNGLIFAQGAPAGGYSLTLRGQNFGVNATSFSSPPRYCVFLPWLYRPQAATTTPTCDGRENFFGEGELMGSLITSRSHTSLSFTVPAGLGTHTLAVSIAGAVLRPFSAGGVSNPMFAYGAPTLFSVSPAHGPTEGGLQVTVSGVGFGRAPLNTSMSPVSFPADGSGISLTTAAALPTVLLRVNTHRGCVTDGYALDGSAFSSTSPMFKCEHAVISHSDSSIVVLSSAGIGVGRTFNVSFLEGPDATANVISSSSLRWDFDPPTINQMIPPVMFVGDAAHTSSSDLGLGCSGKNFGAIADALQDGWTPEEQAVALSVDGVDCAGAQRDQRGSLPVIVCTIPLLAAGPHNVSISVAGQNTTLSSFDVNAFIVACKANFYGSIGQSCLPCPVGATCDGYNASLSPLAARFVDPVPMVGFYNLNGTMASSCPPAVVIAGRSSCIVACVPTSACLGSNLCAVGYESKPPYYRCASCAVGYYQLGATCAQCPQSPLALIVGIALAFIGVAIIGYYLNKKGVNIGYISIGVDWAQVVAIFADAGVQWPPAVLQLLHILSAFNLNIEIVAPECLVPSVNFKQKFAAVMLLPVFVGIMFTVVGSLTFAYKRCVLGRTKNLNRHVGTLMSSLLLIAYFLYIYITRLLLDVFNCTPTDPSDGKLYLQVVFEECGLPGGTQMTLMPWAVLGIIFYTVGYPVFIAQLLWRNREIVMTDQLLRAKGSGLDRLTNPTAYDFRRMYGRSYYQFKPDYAHFWIILIFARKLGIASVGVIFNRNVAFQMAAALLVMFLAYALQVRCVPYMGPGDFDDALASHAAASLTSARHARIRATLANIATSGRKRMRRNLLNHEGTVDRKAVLAVLSSYMFNYNTVESSLLFSAIMVCLMGLMYTAQKSGSAYYAQAEIVITAVIMITLIGTIAYFMTVLLVEVFLMYTEAQRARELAAAQKASGKRPRSQSQSSQKGASHETVAVAGPTDSSVNPLFLSKSGDGTASSLLLGGQAARDAIASLTSPPPPELWTVFRAQFVTFSEQVESLAEQVSALKATAQRHEAINGGEGLELGVLRSRVPVARQSLRGKTQFAQVSTTIDDAPITPGDTFAYTRPASNSLTGTRPASNSLTGTRRPSTSISSLTSNRDSSPLLPGNRALRSNSVRGRTTSHASKDAPGSTAVQVTSPIAKDTSEPYTNQTNDDLTKP